MPLKACIKKLYEIRTRLPAPPRHPELDAREGSGQRELFGVRQYAIIHYLVMDL